MSSIAKWLWFNKPPSDLKVFREILEALEDNDTDRAIKITEEAIIKLGGEIEEMEMEMVESEEVKPNYNVSENNYHK